jgi:glycosyltransferase involved in cell wall biosynthesis
MEILIISPVIPYPLSEGGKVAQYALIDHLRKLHRITLLLTLKNIEDEEFVNKLAGLWNDVDIKIINNIIPVSRGFRKIIIDLARFGYRFLGEKSIDKYELAFPDTFNITGAKSKKFIKHLMNIFSEKKFDLVQIEFLEFIDLALALPPDVKKVFVHHELGIARLESELENDENADVDFRNYALKYVRDREINFLKWYDAIFTFSKTDKEKLQRLIPQLKIYNSPYPVLDNYFLNLKRENFKIKKIVFVGGEKHYPNRDAVEWYINEIEPLNKNKTMLQMDVIGDWTEATIEKFKDKSNVNFLGFVDDLIKVCEDSIMVVPVRIGSGIRTKILYAMAQGIPVVSTTLGCEGLDLTNGREILIENNPIDFADAILRLINDPHYAFSVALNGQKVIKKNYNQQAVAMQRNELLNQIVNQSNYSII